MRGSHRAQSRRSTTTRTGAWSAARRAEMNWQFSPGGSRPCEEAPDKRVRRTSAVPHQAPACTRRPIAGGPLPRPAHGCRKPETSGRSPRSRSGSSRTAAKSHPPSPAHPQSSVPTTSSGAARPPDRLRSRRSPFAQSRHPESSRRHRRRKYGSSLKPLRARAPAGWSIGRPEPETGSPNGRVFL
jgi:hypothetical protein